MKFFFTGTEPVTLRLQGEQYSLDIFPSPNEQTLVGAPAMEAFIFSSFNPFRELFKTPEEMAALAETKPASPKRQTPAKAEAAEASE
jgi:hypothetical protein